MSDTTNTDELRALQARQRAWTGAEPPAEGFPSTREAKELRSAMGLPDLKPMDPPVPAERPERLGG